MYDLRTIQIPKIDDSVQFETLCRDIWKNNSEFENVDINGRPGQAQEGVDVFGRNSTSGNWFGIQCKVRKTNKYLTKDEIYKEINKAKLFNPKLTDYILCTTLERDVNFQKLGREISDELREEKSFNFTIMFWQDIEELLKEEININIYLKYYQKFFIDNTALGHSIGKLMNLELGVEDELDTHYEVIIGKIPNFKDQNHTNANYYRGTYYIINWHEKTVETFPRPCFPTDIEVAFKNQFDRFRITEWLNSIEDIDSFIFDDQNDIEMSISKECRQKFIDSQNEE